MVLNERKHGGLNIGSLKATNLALLGKWWWRFKKEPEALWRKTIVAIHGTNGNLGGSNRSGCWGHICKLNEKLGLGNIDLRCLFCEEDGTWNWGLEDDGIVTVLRKLIDYNLLERNDIQTTWFKHTPGKANILLWRAALNRLPTRFNLEKRGIHLSSILYPLCNNYEETEDHLFLHCRMVKEVENRLRFWFPDFCTFGNNISDIVEEMTKAAGQIAPISEVIHLAFFWVFWRMRNDKVHSGLSKNVIAIVMEVKHMSFMWFRSRVKNYSHLNRDSWSVNPVLASNSTLQN